MKKILFLKKENKYEKDKVYEIEDGTFKPSYYRSLINRGIITEDETKIKEASNVLSEKEKENEIIRNKINPFLNHTFSYYVSIGKVSDLKKYVEIKNSHFELAINKLLNKYLEENHQIKLLSKENILIKIDDIKNKTIIPMQFKYDNYEFKLNVKFIELPLKSPSKRLGVKSIFVKDNSLILTTSDTNNGVIKEKKIYDNDINKVESLQKPENYSVDAVDSKNIELSKNNFTANIINPGRKKNNKNIVVKQDYLERKNIIENKFFGHTFNDTMHIQLAYNILDINKILQLYIDEAVFVLENLPRESNKSYDMIGMLNLDRESNANYVTGENNYKYNYYQYVKEYLKYFAQAFEKDAFDKIKTKASNGKTIKVDNDEKLKKNLYDILRVLSLLRQSSVHGTNMLFTLGQSVKYSNEINIINNRFDTTYNDLINNTINSSKKNIYLIMEWLNIPKTEENKKIVLNKYFDFTINKNYKIEGFDFKYLREKLIEKLGATPDEKDDKKSTFQIINYIIWDTIKDDDNINELVKELMQNNSELNKETIYNKYAIKFAPLLKNIITKERVSFVKDNSLGDDFNIDQSMLDAKNNYSLFSKIIYFLTIFLDTKEINMLVTSLINKLNNISNFIKVLDNKSDLTKDYEMFNNSYKLAKELSTILTIARMQKNINNKKKNDSSNSKANTPNSAMLYDAYCLFGYNSSKDNFNKETESDRDSITKGVASFQNKMVSSIINSNKFRYIIKYAKPSDCYNIMKNENVIKFVLKEIPSQQLDKYLNYRYYDETLENKINYLANDLKSLTIQQIRNDYKNSTSPSSEERMALPKLYMTIVYQIIKQMVRINAYYNIAFSALQRDKKLYGVKDEEKEKNSEETDLLLVDIFTNEDSKYDYYEHDTMSNRSIIKSVLKSNFDTSNKNYKVVNEVKAKDGKEYIQYECQASKLGSTKYSWIKENAEIFRKMFDEKKLYRYSYRNKIAHLNVVANLGAYLSDFCKNGEMNSYFELYQYVMQRSFIKDYEVKKKNNFSKEYLEMKNFIIEKHTYSKNLLHILNMPFAYNVARYKNLTIEDIFYDRFKNIIKEEE